MAKEAPATAEGGKSGPQFSVDIVAVLVMAMKEGSKGTISKQHYEMMSALDGNRTADAFQHALRPVIKRANELLEQKNDGKPFTPVKPTSKKGTATKVKAEGGQAANAGVKRSRAKKVKAEEEDDETAADEKPATTRKRAQPGRAKRARVSYEESADERGVDEGNELDAEYDAETLIKHEDEGMDLTFVCHTPPLEPEFQLTAEDIKAMGLQQDTLDLTFH